MPTDAIGLQSLRKAMFRSGFVGIWTLKRILIWQFSRRCKSLRERLDRNEAFEFGRFFHICSHLHRQERLVLCQSLKFTPRHNRFRPCGAL